MDGFNLVSTASETLTHESIPVFVKLLNEALKIEGIELYKLTYEFGRKYCKIWREGASYGKSIYCFIDLEGNILKAASYRAPAKHSRGTIFDGPAAILNTCGPYGVKYLRGAHIDWRPSVRIQLFAEENRNALREKVGGEEWK